MRASWRPRLIGSLMVVGLWAPAGHTEVRPAVVELFTSEGCSSCPPAEAYLGELARRRDVLALAFHVDYWDDLGWRDRFGLPEAARRQRTYAQVLRLASAYTPQVVVDGKYDFVGSDRRAIDKAVAAPRSGVAVGVSLHDGEVLVQLGAADGMPSGDVILVAFRRSSVTAIGRGENAGRTLEEFNMVRDFRSLGHWAGRAQQLHCRLDALPRDATDVAVLIQPGRQAPIIGAGRLSLR